MSDFNIKVTPKDKADITKFINFFETAHPPYSDFVGKYIFVNIMNPGKHIYNLYHVSNTTAYKLSYMRKNDIGINETIYPVYTLQDLKYDDPIFFYTEAEIEARKKKP